MIPPSLHALLALAMTAQVAQPPVPLLDHRQLSIEQSRLVTEYADILSLLTVGESRAGRRIEAVRLAAGERAPGRPAILLVANLEGPWAWTSGVALHHARKLAEGYAAGDAKIRALLESTTLYIVPRANPDGAEARFEKPLRELAATGAGIDNDRDGASGEDEPQDVDGDGRVAWMRVPDPEGEWTEDPADARALVKAERAKGQRGRWKLVPEGRDSDKDERAAEDPARDAVVNQNFPHLWAEHAPEAGVFATDEPEARALCDFVLHHRDIALVVTYGALDNMVEKPKAVADDAPPQKRIPQPGVLQSDADLLAEIGRRYADLVGSKAKGTGDGKGSFQAWCYAQRGLWTVDLALWSIPLDARAPDQGAQGEQPDAGGKAQDAAPAEKPVEGGAEDKDGKDKKDGKKGDEPSDDAKRLRWIDAEAQAARFLPWTPVEHPELGRVDVGGFAPYAKIEPPEAQMAAIAEKELAFLISLGDVLARVKLVDCTWRKLHDELYEVEAAVEAEGLLPVLSKAARRAREPRPIRLRIELPEDARLVAGQREELLSELDGGSRTERRWLVGTTDPAQVRIVADTDHAGSVRASPEARR